MTDGSNGVGVADDLVALLNAVEHSYIRSTATCRWSDNQMLELALLTTCLDCSVARCAELERTSRYLVGRPVRDH